jgi:hypothetical protein
MGSVSACNLGWQSDTIRSLMPDAGENPHYFDFDLDRGIRQQVVEKLESSPLLALSRLIHRYGSIQTLFVCLRPSRSNLLRNLTVGYSNSVAYLRTREVFYSHHAVAVSSALERSRLALKGRTETPPLSAPPSQYFRQNRRARMRVESSKFSPAHPPRFIAVTHRFQHSFHAGLPVYFLAVTSSASLGLEQTLLESQRYSE